MNVVDLKAARGQSIVEMALVLPLILLTLAVLLQLMLVVHIHMKIHRSAMQLAEQAALGQSLLLTKASVLAGYRTTLLWGFPVPQSHLENLPGWRQYKGIGTATKQNCMAVAEVSYGLRGSWFAALGLPLSDVRAHVELPCEPTDIGDPA